MSGENMPSTTVTLIHLGENNMGSLGPENLTDAAKDAIQSDIGNPEYAGLATDEWLCADGRCSENEMQALEEGNDHEVASQIGGGLIVSETSADMMVPGQTVPLSKQAASRTKTAVSLNKKVTAHGDRPKGKGGCTANVKQREILLFNAANMDIVAPSAWAVSKELGLDNSIEEDDVTESISAGKENTENNALWDITPAELVDTIVENGGQYVVVEGEHTEMVSRGDLTSNGAFRKARFMRDHDGLSAFAADFGKYKEDVYKHATELGMTERDAALQVLRVVIFNTGLLKILQSKEHKVALISEA